MSILERLGVISREDGYTLPKDRYTAAFSVALPRTELEAYADLIDRDEETPFVEDESELTDALSDVFDESLSPDEWRDKMNSPRQRVAPVLETWDDQVETDADVVYFPPGTHALLLEFLGHCKSRGDDDTDPFTVPETVQRAASLVKRVENAEERDQSRVFVAADLVPDVDTA